MDFTEVACALCGKEDYRMGMVRLTGSDGKPIGGGYRCPDGKCALPKSEPKFPFNDGKVVQLHVVNPKQEFTVKKISELEKPHPIQQEFGFKQPEDGSGKRYADRRAKTPWARHTFWWVMHNAVAHPLIAFVPVRLFFRFHDWTSRRMHGVK